jgi:hypothetical protein
VAAAEVVVVLPRLARAVLAAAVVLLLRGCGYPAR